METGGIQEAGDPEGQELLSSSLPTSPSSDGQLSRKDSINEATSSTTRPRITHTDRSASSTDVLRVSSRTSKRLTWKEAQSEMLSGTVVSLALIPESVAFSIVAGVSPIKSLVTTSVMLLASASIGGRPGMISGAGGALAVVSRDLVLNKGEAYLFLAVGLCGLMQIALSALKVDDMLRMLPTSVISGFMCGLAVIIFKSQMHYLGDMNGLAVGWQWMLMLSCLGIVVLRTSERFPSSVPASLLAIVSLTAIVEIMGIQTLRINDIAGDMSERPTIQLPQLVLTLESLLTVLPYSIIFCAIGITETVLTLQVLDTRTMTTGHMRSEIFGQGIGNFLGGFLFSTQGGCAMIVPSTLNISSGGRRSLSVYVCAAQILLFIYIASPLMGRVPVAALVSVLVNMCFSIFDWAQIRRLFKLPRVDAVSTVAVAVLTVVTNLAVGAIAGIFINAFAFAYRMSFGLSVDRSPAVTRRGAPTYRITGKLFWGNAFRLEKAFEISKDVFEGSTHVQVDCKECELIDQSAVHALHSLEQVYVTKGLTVEYTGMPVQSKRLFRSLNASASAHV